MFGCVAENDLCYHFYRVSHIFLRSKQILLQRIKIYKQHKKQKSNQNKKFKITRLIVKEGQKERSVRGCDSPVDEVGRSEGGGSI